MDKNICENCCACGLCDELCPAGAIIKKHKEMDRTIYYDRNQEKCLGCNRCIYNCPQNIQISNKPYKTEYYAVKNKNQKLRLQSTSGGVYSLLAEKIIKDDGVVYGAFMENSKVRHIRIQKFQDIKLLRGSKYVRSDLSGIWGGLSDDLREERTVLFLGTPCQCAAVKQYASLYSNPDLYVCDIICHGVPDAYIFDDYWGYLSYRYGMITQYHFRDKEKGWGKYVESFYDENNKKRYKRIYVRMYLKNLFIRENCFTCKYANTKRIGDITIGDFWGIDNVYPKFNDNKGVSLVIVNSPKGKELFNHIKGESEIKQCAMNDCLQKNLCEPTNKPLERENFYKLYKKFGIEGVVCRYGMPNLINVLKERLK